MEEKWAKEKTTCAVGSIFIKSGSIIETIILKQNVSRLHSRLKVWPSYLISQIPKHLWIFAMKSICFTMLWEYMGKALDSEFWNQSWVCHSLIIFFSQSYFLDLQFFHALKNKGVGITNVTVFSPNSKSLQCYN
jgi:hypothetical protein